MTACHTDNGHTGHSNRIFKIYLALVVCILISTTQIYRIALETTEVKQQQHNNNYELAKEESLGFFDDMDADRWNLHKQKVKKMSPNYHPYWNRHRKDAGMFYQSNFEPDFNCEHEMRIGVMGDGGKWVCDPHRIAKQKSRCLVYSIGSNNDFSFEASVLQDIDRDCEIHTFDMGDYATRASETGVAYHQYGLGGVDDPVQSIKSLKTIVRELGHEGRTIDIFKIDCEGCELESASTWFNANVTLRQIQVEIHSNPLPATTDLFKLMYNNNYVITHKEPNILYPYSLNDYAIEYAFLHLAAGFFE